LGGGLTLATLVWVLGSISGGHLNPAVTIAFLCTGKTNPLLAILYIAAQLVGAITGASLVTTFAPLETAGKLSVTKVHEEVGLLQAWGVETIITFILVLTVFRY
jgi:aquaporin-4